jgi:hypothetical protein
MYILPAKALSIGFFKLTLSIPNKRKANAKIVILSETEAKPCKVVP